MTRFARATGSKGSNDKKPEDATSWTEMKAQMLAKNQVKGPIKNNDNLEGDVDVPTAEEIGNVWAELVSESQAGKNKKRKAAASKDAGNSLTKEKKRKLENNSEANYNQNKKNKISKEEKNEIKSSKKASNTEKNKFSKRLNDNSDENQEHQVSKKKKKKLAKKLLEEDTLNEPALSKKKIKEKPEHLEKEPIEIKKKKKKQPKLIHSSEANVDEPLLSKNKESLNKKEESHNSSTEKIGANGLIYAEPKVKEKKRRKEELKPSEVLINGKPVQLAPFDGFVVQAEDAQRLKELRQTMKAKGIPEAEREKSIKLERRRAEKALARLKKKVCFHCRGSGHNLSECPQVQDDQRATGICYKCGSTEHTHYQCRVTRTDDYRFAECFICKEQGHISKQCPDNPRGLYPRGGACATCGDVTHLKKDCPKYLAEKEDETVTIGTRNNRALEALDEDFQTLPMIPKNNFKKPKQHIKF